MINICKHRINKKYLIIFLLTLFTMIIQYVMTRSIDKNGTYFLTEVFQTGLILCICYFLYDGKNKECKKRAEIEEQYNDANNRIMDSLMKEFEIVDSIPLGIIFTQNGKCTYANKETIKIFHGNSTMDIMNFDFSKFISKESMSVKEHELNAIDGTTIYVEIVTVPHVVYGYEKDISVIIDISDKIAIREKNIFIEEYVEKEKEKLELLANLSHEFSTPINLILSAVQLTELYLNNNKFNYSLYKENLNVIKLNSYRLNRTISNVLDILSMEKGYYNMHFQNSNIVEFVENIIDQVVPLVEDRGKSIVFDTDIEEKIIAFDEEKIKKVVLNLITNAVKYTGDNGKIKVKINDKDDYVSISFIDNGIGIPKEKKETLFDNFTQIDKSLKRSREGMGIGLSITKSIVNAHGGKIDVVSEYGIGSEFIVKIPSKIVKMEDRSWKRVTRGLEVDDIEMEFSDIPIKNVDK